MSETVASTASFTLAIDELIEEALDMIAVEGEQMASKDGYSTYEARSARRSLNLLLIDLTNREYPLGHLEQRTLTLVAGQDEYNLATDALAILDLNYKDANGIEVPVRAMSPFDYFNLTNKAIENTRPSAYCFDRTSSTPKIRVWPVPLTGGSDLGELTYWVIRRHKDITKSYQLVDLNYRYLPALSAGLAYFMGLKKPTLDLDRLATIKQEYQDRLEAAFMEDRDRIDLVIVPDIKRRR